MLGIYYGRTSFMDYSKGQTRERTFPVGKVLLLSFSSDELLLVLAAEQSRQDGRPFLPNRVQGVRIQAQELQDRGRHLSRFHKTVHGPSRKARIGYQQHHVGVVMREAAML